MSFHILTVCTGNICRSPAMESLLVHLFAEYPEVTVSSAGTFAHDGEAMQPPMQNRVSAYGADAHLSVGTQLSSAMIDEADLVLAATAIHVEDILTTHRGATEKVFLVRELGEILEQLPRVTFDQDQPISDRLAQIIAQARAAQGRSQSAGVDYDVVDPYMLPASVYDESFAQLSEPLELLAEKVTV